jgi:hypothetical protein
MPSEKTRGSTLGMVCVAGGGALRPPGAPASYV